MDDTTTHTEQRVTSDSAGSESEPLFRRDILSCVATGAAALGLGTNGASASEHDVADVWFLTGQLDFPVDDFQYNPHPFNGTTHAQYGLWAQYAHYNYETGEFVPHLVEDWEVGETELILTLREDVTWEDGEPVDAESLTTQWDVYEQTDHALFDVADSVEATGEYELTIGYPAGTNTSVVEHAVLHEAADMPPQDWGDYDGEGLTAYEVPEPTSSGPLVLTAQESNYHEYVPRSRVSDAADHPYAENYNWNGYRMQYIQSNQAAHQGFVDHDLDGLHSLFVQETTLDSFPDSVEEITFPGEFGMGLWFNHDRSPFDQREVRQAIAYSLDLEEVLAQLGDGKKIHHPTQTGMTDTNVQNWFDGYDVEGLHEYEQDPEQVQSLLEEAGLSLGEVQPNIVVPAGWSDWVLMASQIGNQLGMVGWDVTVNTLGGSYWSARGNGDFDVVAMPHKDVARHNHPYFALRWQLYGRAGTPANVSNYAAPDEETTVEVDGETIDVEAAFEALATTQDEDEQTELIRQLATVVNRDLPYIHVAQKYEQHFIDRQRWAFPEEHELLNTRWPLWVLPKTDEDLGDYRDDLAPETPGLLKSTAGADCTDGPDGQTVCDVNGDGDYRDVTGDGAVGQGDVAAFFRTQHRSAWKQPDLFDYSGNGRVSHGDVVDLFDYVATQ